MKNRAIAFVLTLTLIFGMVAGVIPVRALAAANAGKIIEANDDVPLRLYYDEEASHGIDTKFETLDTSTGSSASEIGNNVDDDWERWSIPLGNGYFGANIFGRTNTERIQLTEKTLANPYKIVDDQERNLPTDGLNNFSETYIDFGHSGGITNYSRELDLRTAISTVKYTYSGVNYTREYFTSYPDNAMVIKLDASNAGALNFTLRPTVPYEQEYMTDPGDRGGKTGTVTSSVANGVGTVVLSGKLEYFDVDFYGLYRVYTDGNLTAGTVVNANGESDGVIEVSGATNAYIVVTLGTDYELSSETFTASPVNKPTFSTGIEDARAKVEGYMNALDAVTSDSNSYEEKYQALRARHVADYSSLFGRVSLELNFNSGDLLLTTDELLNQYKNGSGSSYLEALYFQYGRYLLIASSREGALPANLQGTWNRYNHAPWSSGYWHNVNVQMNYWPAFSTNLAETFKAYVDYNSAYMQDAKNGATSQINSLNPGMLGQDGGNGWSIETGGYVYDVNSSSSIGNLGFTTQLFWEYYAYTSDEELLSEVVYPILADAARFITKAVFLDEDGHYLAIRTDSPEQYVNGKWYYTTGTTYAQSFAYQNNYNLLLAAKELGIDVSDASGKDYAILQRVMEQLDKYDPIVIGLSGQVKEFREEEYYGDLGEKDHRHISQLVGLYPGNLINGTTPAWLDASEYVLTERGDKATGWGVAHRLNLWARVQNGERAYDLLEQLLKQNTATNLWDLHPPFQIDGNLGGTAGISEMLLQSHAGYLEPLAAIPSVWANGSYTGLVARGNFEVAAEWENGLATCFNLKSLAGGSASVKYSGIDRAVVTDSEGRLVSYTVTGDDIITFDTEVGQTYIISGFEREIKPEAVTGLTATTDFLAPTTLSWNASSDAVAYNVYVAKDNDAAYTHLIKTVNTGYVYIPDELENSRLTFAVTAINAYGVESDRALLYRNPDDTSAVITSVSANVIDGELQVAIGANDLAGTFRLYSKEKSNSPWTLVTESKFPIIIHEGFSSSFIWGVSVESFFGGESEIKEITSYNKSFDELDYKVSDILENRTFKATEESVNCKHNSNFGLFSRLTDFDFNVSTGRFSTKTSASDVLEGVINLPTLFLLGELQLYDFNANAEYVGSHIKIEIAIDGEWTTAAELNSQADIKALRKSGTYGSYIGIDLSGYQAQQIRIRIDSPISVSGTQRSISLNEIACTGFALNKGMTYNDNILLGMDINCTEQTMVHAATSSDSSGMEGLTDGTRKGDDGVKLWRTWFGKQNMEFDGTVDLCGEAMLDELRLYAYQNTWRCVGPKIQIQVYYDGVWTTVYDLDLEAVGTSKYLKQIMDGSTVKEVYLAFDMQNIKAEKIRIYLPPKSTTGEAYGMYEIELDGYYKPDNSQWKNNLFEGLEFIPAADAKVYNNNVYSNLTDGDNSNNSRLVTNGGSPLDATLTFDKAYARLELLTVYYNTLSGQDRCGSGLQVMVLSGGEWTTVVSKDYIADGTNYSKQAVTFDLGGVEAEAIRIYDDGVYPGANCIEIWEITCTGELVPADREWSENILSGYAFEKGPDAGNIWEPHDYYRITDGVLSDNNRFSTSGGAAADGILDFGGKLVQLYTLKVNYSKGSANRCGADFTVQVWRDGQWNDVITYVHTNPTSYMEYDLGGVFAEKLRFKVSTKYSAGDCTQIYEMTCTGYTYNAEETGGVGENKDSNILLGTTIDRVSVSKNPEVDSTKTPTLHSSVPDLTKAFDGNTATSSRYAMLDWSSAPAGYSLTIDLGAKQSLYTLSIYPWYDGSTASRSNNTSVDVYDDGVWVRIASGFVITPSANPTTVDLMGVKGSMIRINFMNTSSGQMASITEIKCTTGTVNAIDRSELLLAYKALDAVEGDDFGFDKVKEIRMRELKELLVDPDATATEIAEYVNTVNQAVETLSAGVPVSDKYGDFTQYSISLEGDISFNFFASVAANAVSENPDAQVYVVYADGSAKSIALSSLPTDTSGRIVLSLDMAAAQMTDSVRIRLIVNGDACGAEINQSVKTYADQILNSDEYKNEHELVRAMLNYGAYAQKFFNYNTENLANAGYESDLDGVTEDAEISVNGAASGLELRSWSLSLESEVEASLFFVIGEDANVSNYTAKVITPDGTEYAVDINEVGSRYSVVIKNIASGYLAENYTVVITNSIDSSSISVELSAMCYVSTVLSGSVDNSALADLCRALKLYSDAAQAYFEN